MAVLVAGSFDPITNGHVDLIKRASEMFGKVHAVAMINRAKAYMFSLEERCVLMEKALAGIPGVEVHSWDGMLYDYVERNGIKVVVKGLRTAEDFEYEMEQALYNRKMCGVQTVFLPASEEYIGLSSTKVREASARGADISGMVGKDTIDAINGKKA